MNGAEVIRVNPADVERGVPYRFSWGPERPGGEFIETPPSPRCETARRTRSIDRGYVVASIPDKRTMVGDLLTISASDGRTYMVRTDATGLEVIAAVYPFGRGVSIGDLSCTVCDVTVDLGDEDIEAGRRMARHFEQHGPGRCEASRLDIIERGGIVPPWSLAQVDALNRWQRSPMVHPFTCSRCRDLDKRLGLNPRDFPLVATTAGFVCRTCDYRQTWAHGFMLTTPPDYLARFRVDGEPPRRAR